jgi:hypothetical protein
MPKPMRESDANRANRRKARGNQTKADWTSVPADLLQQSIATIASAGGAIRFGYTRDGGAYAVGILGDGDPYTEYLRPADNIVEYFETLCQEWEDGTPLP